LREELLKLDSLEDLRDIDAPAPALSGKAGLRVRGGVAADDLPVPHEHRPDRRDTVRTHLLYSAVTCGGNREDEHNRQRSNQRRESDSMNRGDRHVDPSSERIPVSRGYVLAAVTSYYLCRGWWLRLVPRRSRRRY
jgi:hypothetical protein